MPRFSTPLHAHRAFLPTSVGGAASPPFSPEPASLPWRWLATGNKPLQRLVAHRRIASQLRAATEPLLLCTGQPRTHYKRVLIPVDFSPSTLAAARLAATHLVAGLSAQLAFLAPFTLADAAPGLSQFARDTSVSSLVEARDALRARLAAFVQELDIPHDLVSVVARHGSLEVASASYARQMQCDLLVLGRRAAPALEMFAGGGVEWRLHRQLATDVLVVPA